MKDNDLFNQYNVRTNPENFKSIGRGLHGDIYEGIYNGKKTAIKIFDKGTNNILELNILSIMSHPNIIEVYKIIYSLENKKIILPGSHLRDLFLNKI